MQRTGLRTASLLVLMGLTAHADTSTVFGMDLHKPFGVQECRHTRLGKTSGYYIQSLDSVCYELINENDPNAGKHAPISYDTVKIDWPIALKPQLVGGPGFALAKIMDGNLEGVSFNTMGIQSQERDLQLLIDKFGEPTVKNRQTVQNGYGAKFSAVRVSWEIDDLVVSYDSAPNSINSGLVHIESVRAAADRKAQMDKLTHGGQSL